MWYGLVEQLECDGLPSTEILSLLSFAIYSYPYLMDALLFIAR